LISAFPRQSSDPKSADIYFGAEMERKDAVRKGREAEDRVYQKLELLGMNPKMMPWKHPFDILLGNGKRIDVKTTDTYMNIKVGSRSYKYYRFRTRKEQKQDFADFFILVIENDYYVIPYEAAPRDNIFLYKHICKTAKWSRFLNAFSLLVK
jgi:hypothetical protein